MKVVEKWQQIGRQVKAIATMAVEFVRTGELPSNTAAAQLTQLLEVTPETISCYASASVVAAWPDVKKHLEAGADAMRRARGDKARVALNYIYQQ
eukprot:5805538-Pyramimonas_sp.AAC.1